MRIQLFGVGTKSESRAITAQRRINCMVDVRREGDRTTYALINRPGLTPFTTQLGINPSRGMWAVNSITSPMLFTVNGNTLYAINNAGVITTIGNILTGTGNVSFADDGTFLVFVDGKNGYWFNLAGGAINLITDGNFTTSPTTVTWQDNYFIVTSGDNRQFQLSQISPSVDPSVWPAIQIAFAGSSPGKLQAGIADHSILCLFGDIYSEFWQDAGTPDFPYALIPGSSTEFGLCSPWTLAKYDNSLVGLFRNRMGGINVSRLAGFNLKRVSDHDMDEIFATYPTGAINSAQGFTFQNGGHPLYFITFPGEQSWFFDESSQIWTEVQAPNGTRFWGNKCAVFQGKALVSDYRNGNIYQFDINNYTDNGEYVGLEVWSKHIWNDDKYLGIRRIQIDIESGVGRSVGTAASGLINYIDPQGLISTYGLSINATASKITGDIDIRGYVAPDTWTPANYQIILTRDKPGETPLMAYQFGINTDGTLYIKWSPDGTVINTKSSTSPAGGSAGVGLWVRATLQVDNGAGGNTVKFYKSTDCGVTWAQVGADVVTAGTTSIWGLATFLELGAEFTGLDPTHTLIGKIYETQIYDGIGGTLAADALMNDATVGATIWNSVATGEHYSLASMVIQQQSVVGGTCGATVIPGTLDLNAQNPFIELFVSKDGGWTFYSVGFDSMGKIGEYKTRVIWNSLGAARDWVLKLRITDPVKRVITGASAEIEGGSF